MALSHFHWPYLPQVYWKIWFRHHAPSPVKETQRDKYFHLQLHCLWDTSSFSSCSWRLLNQGHSVLWAPWSQKDHFRSWKFLESTHIKAHFGADEYLIIFGQTFYRIFLVSYHLKSDWFWGLCLTKRWFELMSKILWRIRGKAKCQHLSIAHPFDFKPELSQTKFGRYFPKLVYWAKIWGLHCMQNRQ